MDDVFISWKDTQDPAGCNAGEEEYYYFTRDPARTPMQWDTTKNAGFSTATKTWLPLADDYQKQNVQIQKQEPFSHLKIFKTLTSLRKSKTFQDGTFNMKVVDNDVLVYERSLTGSETFVVVLNFSKTNKTINLTNSFPSLSKNLEVIVSSLTSEYLPG